jgi:hypothetical protein
MNAQNSVTVSENRPVMILIMLFFACFAVVRGLIILFFFEPFNSESLFQIAVVLPLGFIFTRQLLLLLFNRRTIMVVNNRVLIKKGLFVKAVHLDETSRVLFYRFIPDKLMAVKDGFANDYYVFIKRQIRGFFNLNSDVKILIRNLKKEVSIAKNLSIPDAVLLSNYLNRFTKTEVESKTY